jgi:hypothetical protein
MTSIGKKWRNEGEHIHCFGSNEVAMSELLKKIPSNVMTVTVRGDLLLPASKHARVLISAIAASSEGRENKTMNAVQIHVGPFYLPHGIGLHSSWSAKAGEWLKGAFEIATFEVEEVITGGGSDCQASRAIDETMV